MNKDEPLLLPFVAIVLLVAIFFATVAAMDAAETALEPEPTVECETETDTEVEDRDPDEQFVEEVVIPYIIYTSVL